MITLPSLPTDNLYKFLFIGGLSLILTGVILFYTQNDKINSEINQIEIESQKTGTEYTFLKEDLTDLINQINRISKEISEVNQLDSSSNRKNNRENSKLFSKDENKIVPYYKKMELLQSKKIEYKNKLRELILKQGMTTLQIKQLRIKFYELLFLFIIANLLTISGIFLAKFGYKQWYNLVQKPLDDKLKYELEQLKNNQAV